MIMEKAFHISQALHVLKSPLLKCHISGLIWHLKLVFNVVGLKKKRSFMNKMSISFPSGGVLYISVKYLKQGGGAEMGSESRSIKYK